MLACSFALIRAPLLSARAPGSCLSTIASAVRISPSSKTRLGGKSAGALSSWSRDEDDSALTMVARQRRAGACGRGGIKRVSGQGDVTIQARDTDGCERAQTSKHGEQECKRVRDPSLYSWASTELPFRS